MNYMIQLSAVALFGIILHGFLAWTAFHMTGEPQQLRNVTWFGSSIIRAGEMLVVFDGEGLLTLEGVNFSTTLEDATELSELVPQELGLSGLQVATPGEPTVMLHEMGVIWSEGLGGFLTVKGRPERNHLFSPLVLFAWMNVVLALLYLLEAAGAIYVEQRYHYLSTTKKVALLFTLRTTRRLVISVFEIPLILFLAGVRSLPHYGIWLAFTFSMELLKLFNPFTSLLFLGRSDEIMGPWQEEREGLVRLQQNFTSFAQMLEISRTLLLVALVRGWGLTHPLFWEELSAFFTLGPNVLLSVAIVIYLLTGQLASLLFTAFNSVFISRTFWEAKDVSLEQHERREGLTHRAYNLCFRRGSEFFYFFVDSLIQVSLSSGFYYLVLASFSDDNFLSV